MTELAEARTGQPIDPTTIEDPAGFATALTQLRLDVGRSIRDVARSTGIPSATLGGWFSGRHLPPPTQPQVLEQVLDALGVRHPGQVRLWRDALLRARRAASARVGGGPEQSRTTGASPYRGLEPFTEQDAALFFGREDVVDDLVRAVRSRATDPALSQLLVVVGPSGSGKSSVLRAGLVPRVRALREPSDEETGELSGHPWGVAVMVPGVDPMAALAAVDAELGRSSRMLLVIDQAEEVFSPEVGAQARQQFLRTLAARADEAQATGRALVVVAGLRADFYGQAASDPLVLPSLQRSQVLLGAMSIDELRLAVIRPAEAVGVSVDSELIDLLLRDLTPRGQASPGYEAGALPLVSHALLSAWQRHAGSRLTVADYVAAGGIAGAVQQTAEKVVAGLDDNGRAAAQWLFTQLVSVDDDGAMTRRRVRHDDLRHPDPATDLALDPVIEAFIAGRLLTADRGTLEISHEALLSAWPRLRDWVLTDLDAARLQRRIADAATGWRDHDRDPALLLRGAPLADAQVLADRPATSSRTLTAPEQEFVTASLAQQSQVQSAERRRTSRLRALVAVMTALAVLAGLLAVTAFQARDEARVQQQRATQARDDATSRQLAIAADSMRRTDPALAAQLALAAYRASPTLQARSSLLGSTGVATPTRIVGPVGPMHATANPDGSVLAVSGADGVTRLWAKVSDAASTSPAWQVAGYQPIGQLDPVDEASGVVASTFSPDGTLLALATTAGGLVLWDMSQPAEPRLVDSTAAAGSVRGLAFSGDGGQLAAATSQPAVQRWQVPRSASAGRLTELPAITGFGGDVNSVVFAPTGATLASGSSDGTVRLWSAPADGKPRLLDEAAAGPPTDFVFGVAFSPNGERLLSSSKHQVLMWDVTDRSSLATRGEPFTDFDSWVNSVSFSPDGSQFAAGSSDTTVKVYDTEDATLLATLPNPAGVTAVQYVGDGSALLTSEDGGVARLWPLPGPVLAGFGDTIWNLGRDSSDATLMVAPGAGDGSVHLLGQSGTGAGRLSERLTPPEAAGQADGAGAISADGRWLAAGTATGNVAVWERPTAGEPAQLADVVNIGDQLVEGVAFSHDGTLLAGIADDSAVVVWRLHEGSEPKEAYRLSAEGVPLGVAVSPDSSVLAAATSHGAVQLWALADADGHPLAQPTQLPALTGFDNSVYAVAFDPSGRYLAAGSTDRTVRLWDVRDPAAAVTVGDPLRGPRGSVYALSWSEDSALLAGAESGSSGSVWLWETRDPAAPSVRATLPTVPDSLNAVVLRGDGQLVTGAGSAGAVRTWQTDVQAVAGEVCARTGTAMTQEEWEQSVAGVPFVAPCPAAP